MIQAPRKFWAKVDQTGGADACWPWRGYVNRHGYGQTSVKMDGRWRRAQASQVAYWLATGVWERKADGRVVRHTCDHRPCCNPAHLIGGTLADNSADAVARDRMARGERHFAAKLTAAQVAEIRDRAAAGETYRALAAAYGVSAGNIGDVVRGAVWRREPGAIDGGPGRRRGERTPQAKLREEDVRDIRARVAAGESQRAVARAYGVTHTTVWEIIQGKTWAHLE